ncbi:MAG: ribonuclease P protein component [Lewinellaceae bacterium]|nr:ribonuclease P protein component [Lewinellaceae bacterium]
MNAPIHTFSRSERLKSRTLISRLFKDSHSYVAYPLRVVWLEHPAPAHPDKQVSTVKVVISVPKRHFKTAVARNRLKRQIREAYRLHKHLFYEKLAGRNDMAFLNSQLSFVSLYYQNMGTL